MERSKFHWSILRTKSTQPSDKQVGGVTPELKFYLDPATTELPLTAPKDPLALAAGGRAIGGVWMAGTFPRQIWSAPPSTPSS